MRALISLTTRSAMSRSRSDNSRAASALAASPMDMLPMSAIELLLLAIHETYPGHQAERSVKEDQLVRHGGRLEESIVLVPTPQSLITEGIAEVAPHILLGGDNGQVFSAILAEAGVELDLGHVLAVERAARPCRWAEVNARFRAAFSS